MKHKLFLAAASILTLWSTTCSALSYGESVVSDFTIRLIDLDPNDGIAPAMTIVASPFDGTTMGRSEAGVEIYGSDTQPPIQRYMTSTPFSPVDAKASFMGYYADSASFGSPFSSGALSKSFATRSAADHYGYVVGHQYSSIYFSLTPNTKAILSGDFAASAFSNSTDDIGSGQIRAVLGIGFNGSKFTKMDEQSLIVTAVGGGSADYESGFRPFSYAVNEHLGSDVFYFSIGSGAVAYANIIPEPSTLLMVAVGLALVAASRTNIGRKH